MVEPTAREAATDDGRRSRINLLIVVLLAVQLLVPLRYYLGFAEGDDERFSWRMFSTVRLQRCEMNVSEVRAGNAEPQVLNLKPILQVAWISILQRYRPSVVEAFMRSRCAAEGVEKVLYDRRCLAPDGASLPPDRLDLTCDSGLLREVGQP